LVTQPTCAPSLIDLTVPALFGLSLDGQSPDLDNCFS
jgi:hypothetical protein